MLGTKGENQKPGKSLFEQKETCMNAQAIMSVVLNQDDIQRSCWGQLFEKNECIFVDDQSLYSNGFQFEHIFARSFAYVGRK